MEDLKSLAKAAKKRLKTNYWEICKEDIDRNTAEAVSRGINGNKAKSTLTERVKSEIKGEKEDEFYLRVKALLDAEGEVSDAIGRLTDRAVYDGLSYEEKQRYTLELSGKYLAALERYRNEKQAGV